MFNRKFRPITHYKYRIDNNIQARTTELTIHGQDILLKCYLSNNYSARNRRQFLLSLYYKILPFFDFVYASKVHHDHHIDDFTGRKQVEILSLRQGICIEEEKHKIAYLIRGVRTREGKTQVEFSKELKISSTYLSKIEKGHRLPGPKLIQRILEIKKPQRNL